MQLFGLILLGMSIAMVLGAARKQSSRAGFVVPNLRGKYLPIVACLFQALAPDGEAGSYRIAALAFSFVLLLWFTWQNRSYRPMHLLFIMSLLNLIPNAIHRGYMPITAEMMATLFLNHASPWPSGPVGPGSKDIIVSMAEAPLWMLGDIFAVCPPSPYHMAFSIGGHIRCGSLPMGILLYSIRATNGSSHSELGRLVKAGVINPDLQQALVRSPGTATESTLAQPFRLNADERTFLQTLRPGNYADFVGEMLHWLASCSLVVAERHEIPAPRHALPVTPTISVSLTCPGESTRTASMLIEFRWVPRFPTCCC
jgi:uncharacterized protein DUF5317